jgi:hypothetical protein
MEKIIDFLLTKDDAKISVEDFRKEIYKLRISDKEITELEKYLRDNGYIERRGKTIYITNYIVTE